MKKTSVKKVRPPSSWCSVVWSAVGFGWQKNKQNCNNLFLDHVSAQQFLYLYIMSLCSICKRRLPACCGVFSELFSENNSCKLRVKGHLHRLAHSHHPVKLDVFFTDMECTWFLYLKLTEGAVYLPNDMMTITFFVQIGPFFFFFVSFNFSELKKKGGSKS